MARYYVSRDDDLATVAAELLEAAPDRRSVVYVPGAHPNGAFDLPDDLAESYHADRSGKAAQARQENDAAAEKLRDADRIARQAPGPGEPTQEDLRSPEEKTNTVQGTFDEDAPVRQPVRQPVRRTGRRAQTTEE